jgi:hypothetical protein
MVGLNHKSMPLKALTCLQTISWMTQWGIWKKSYVKIMGKYGIGNKIEDYVNMWKR